MGFRDMPYPKSRTIGPIIKSNVVMHQVSLIAAFGLAGAFAACGSQEPAFTENRTATDVQSADATAQGSAQDLGNEANQTPIIQDADAEDDGTGDQNGGTGTGSDGGSGSAGSGTSTGGGGSTTGGLAGGVSTAGGTSTGGSTAGGSTAGGADGGVGTGGSSAGGSSAGGADGGLSLTQVTMNLTQKGPGKVDILWVVDTSGSMAEEQAYLGNNFNALITQLKNAGHDFQTAITTTDVCQDTLPASLADRVCPVDYGGSPATHLRGSFVGTTGRKVLKSTDVDLVSRFNTYVNQGVDASGFEHGLKAADLAITKSLSGQNDALIRPDAFLAVIVVSDEEDDGIGLSKVDAYNGHNFFSEGLTSFRFTEDNMIASLRAVKGEGHFSISAITPTRKADGTLCSAPHSQPAEEGTQYIKAAQKTGGILQSICDTNWNTSLGQIGLDLNGQITQATLEFEPNVPTIMVYVNEVLSTDWTYNAGNNAVKFNSGHVPAAGAQIKITYYKAH